MLTGASIRKDITGAPNIVLLHVSPVSIFVMTNGILAMFASKCQRMIK
jgi:hypothetical protein